MSKIKRMLLALGRKQEKYGLIIALVILVVEVIAIFVDTNKILALVATSMIYLALILFCIARRVSKYSEEVLEKNHLANILLSDVNIVGTIFIFPWIITIARLPDMAWYLSLGLCVVVSTTWVLVTWGVVKYFNKKLIK